MFASLNQMNYKFTKRQDDIISLCYMIFYILNNSEMPGLDSFINSESLDDISEIEKDTILKSVKTMARELGFLDIGRIKFKNELLTGKSYKFNDPINHHIGTTRMANTSENGVVDKNCKVFGISNLYVAGSSVFSTSSIVNPTYTIIALSLRLGEYLKNIKI